MLHYTSLFADIEALFAGAGHDPASFRRFAREVERFAESLRDYCGEVAGDYVARLEQRLGQPDVRLSAEEVALLRTYLGLAPADPERDQRLVADLAGIEDDLGAALRLRDRPLSLENLDRLRRLLDRIRGALPRVLTTLEAREEGARFEEAIGDPNGAEPRPLDRAWLRRAIRSRAGASDGSSSEEELPTVPGG